MNVALAAVAGVVVAGAVVAVSAREARAALLGLLVALLATPLLADPLASPLAIAGRLVAAVLACRLIAVAIRGSAVQTTGSRIGWPVEALAAGAGAVIGFGSHGLGAPGSGPAEAQAAGFALGVLAAAPIVAGRDVLRLGIGAVLLLLGGALVRVGLAGTPTDLEQLVSSGLIVGLGGAVGLIALAAREAVAGLAISDQAAGIGPPGRPRDHYERRTRRVGVGRP